MDKKCLNCQKVFYKPINESKKNWEIRHKYCSHECANLGSGLFISQNFYRNCLYCRKSVKVIKARLSSFKYCSRQCKDKDLLGKTAWNKDKKGLQIAWNKGKKRWWKSSGEFKKGDNLNEKHPLWKGKNASYISIHTWVARHKGKPKKCEHCGNTTKQRYEWANIDGKYSRNLDDYIRLCKSCHTKYDIKRLAAIIPA